MAATLLVIRLALAAILLAAAAGKWAGQQRFRQALAEFGVPASLRSPLARLIPAIEAALGALLVPNGTVQWGAAGAAILLTLFAAVIGYQLARGRQPRCNCFGAAGERPIGFTTLLRNAWLAGAALLLTAGDRSSSDALLSAMLTAAPSATPLAVAVAGVGMLTTLHMWMLTRVLRQHGQLVMRVDAMEQQLSAVSHPETSAHAGLPLGSAAPELGPPPSLPRIVIFSDPDCPACGDLRTDIRRWQRIHRDSLELVVVTRRGSDRDPVADVGNLVLQSGGEIAGAYRIAGTPAAVLVDASSRIASNTATGVAAIRALVATTTTPTMGARIPDLRVRTGRGGVDSLRALIKRTTVLLFWNADCPFCRAMLPQLASWERTRQADAPDLLLIAPREAAARLHELQSSVLIDEDAAAGELRAAATPSALLVDDRWTIRSELALGAPAVLGLLGAAEQRPLHP